MLKIRIIRDNDKLWDGDYPRLMRDVKNGDILLVLSFGQAFNATRIFDNNLKEVSAANGLWSLGRLEHFGGSIEIENL